LTETSELLWEPATDARTATAMGRFLDWVHATRQRSLPDHEAAWQWSVDDLEGFWWSVWEFYEIDPDVIRMAREHFTYLDDCRGEVEIVPGDARLALEREPPQEYDVLVLDAFSSDAIPVHLLTVEAFEVYLRHLKPDGILAFHISSRHFDLAPVMAGLSDRFGLAAALVETLGNDDLGTFDCRWVLLSRDRSRLAEVAAETRPLPSKERHVVWTDGYSNPFGVLISRDGSAEE
jgi:SAM-dependent methyltransferase